MRIQFVKKQVKLQGKPGLSFAAITNVGNKRSNNEDNFRVNALFRENVSDNNYQVDGESEIEGSVLAVCDGMGGEERGEEASLLAVRSIEPSLTLHSVEETFSRSVDTANQAICDLINQHAGVRSGSTIASLYFSEGMYKAANIGDSRVYVLSGGELKLLTRDHNQAQDLVEFGVLTREEADKSPQKHMLTQHLGIFPDEMILCPHFSESYAYHSGDVFLLCSDGLTDSIDEQEMKAIMEVDAPVKERAEALIRAALYAGGKDNVTVVLCQIR